MSTYQQSTVNPAYFDMPVFEAPDEFLFSVARQKQRKFDMGIDSVRQQYNSMANLPVTSPYAISKRDALMQEANEKLRKIAGADFSLDENRAIANSIYKPISSDTDILYDLSETKRGQKETALMDNLQNSKDEKERALYWDTGREYVNTSIRQLQSAKTADELRKVRVRNFVPYSDIIGKLNTAATNLKLNVSIDSINGGYVLTKENGELANIPFYLFAQSQLGTPELEVLKVLGTVASEKDLSTEMLLNGGNSELAKQTLASKAIKSSFDSISEQLDDNTKNLSRLESRREALISSKRNNWTEEDEAKLNEIDDQREMIASSNKLLGNKLRDIGYDQFQGNYIKNSNYDRTLNFYKNDLSAPYSEIARKNITMNWAAGLASAKTSLKISPNQLFTESLRLQTEASKLRAKSEGGSETGTTKSKKEGSEDLINVPLQLGNNPFGTETVTTYDLFNRTKNTYETELYGRGTDFIQDSGIDLSADFLTDLADNLKKGAANESIKNSKSPYNLSEKYAEDIAKIEEMVKNGNISLPSVAPGKLSLSHSDVFEALINQASLLTKDKLDNPPETAEEINHIVKSYQEVDNHLKAYRVFREDEENIKKKVLSSGKYSLIQGPDGKIMSKEEAINSWTGGKIQEFTESLQSNPDIEELLKTNDPLSIIRITRDITNLQDIRTMVGVRKQLGKIYDSYKNKFEGDFTKFINQENPKFLSYIKTPDGKLGYTYPIQQWKLRKNPEDTNESELGDIILKRAFDLQNLTDPTKILNLDRLGNEKKTMDIVNYIQGSLESDITPDMGTVYTSQIGSDGKSPSVIFKPSMTFLKQFAEKGDVNKDKDLLMIARNGIEIAADIPEIEKYRPSLVGRLIDIDKKFVILPELKDKGFSAKIEKQTNGRGYKILLDYKRFNQDGSEVVEVNKEPYPGLYVPEQRLDMLSTTMINDLLAQYIAYTNQKKSMQATKSFDQEAYEKNRQLR